MSELTNAPQEWQAPTDAPDVDMVRLVIQQGGTLLLPPEVRTAMLLDPSGCVTATVVDGELRVISTMAAIRPIQRMVAEHDTGTGSPVDELDRRAARRGAAGREGSRSVGV